MKKILVVDDEPDIRDMIAGFLNDNGYDAKQAASGPQAITMIEKDKPDLRLRNRGGRRGQAQTCEKIFEV